jgi:hypothetical protein
MLIVHLYRELAHWLAVQTGTYIPPGQYSDKYNFWSGFGSDIGEVLILGGVIQLYRKHNCHVTNCWRIAHHKQVDNATGTEYPLCKKHYRAVHPEVPKRLELEHLIRIHKKNKARTR